MRKIWLGGRTAELLLTLRLGTRYIKSDLTADWLEGKGDPGIGGT